MRNVVKEAPDVTVIDVIVSRLYFSQYNLHNPLDPHMGPIATGPFVE